ncbi:MAG TPA: hypothetical protein VFH47_00500 [Candidatus Thermoplasmatota archaeon]|nr:hypothetical protein [Candidatus Thermoplasmatota archaeon]
MVLPPLLTVVWTMLRTLVFPLVTLPRAAGGPVYMLMLAAYLAVVMVAAGRLRWGWLLAPGFLALLLVSMQVPGLHCMLAGCSGLLAGLELLLLWPGAAVAAAFGAWWGAHERRQARRAAQAAASAAPAAPPAPQP